MQLFEDTHSFKKIIKSKKPWQWLGIGICFIAGTSISLFAVFNLLTVTEEEVVTSQDISSQVCEQSAGFGELTVYISGAITKPGLYVLPFESRVSDLIEIAGGVSKTADIVYVHKQVNFAKRLNDSEQVYIPTKSESLAQIQQVSSKTTKGPISINSSTLEELMTLNGIGEVRAAKIIDNRPYSDFTELVEKEVLTQLMYEKIENQISI